MVTITNKVTFNNYIEGDNTVSLTIHDLNYSKVAIGFMNAASFGGGVNVNCGELLINAGAALNGGIIKVGNGNTRTCKLYTNDPALPITVANDIVVPAGSAFSYIGGLNISNTPLLYW
jgi:hypothetical protein